MHSTKNANLDQTLSLNAITANLALREAFFIART